MINAQSKIRNAQRNAVGSIDIEVELDDGRWVPFTASEDDLEDHGKALHARAVAELTVADYVAPPPPTAAEFDMLADEVADAFLDQDKKTKALGMVMADIVERAFGVSQTVARQQVRTRFRNYYRGLMDE